MRFIKNDELSRPDSSEIDSIKRMPVVVVMDNVRSGQNVGSVFRTCDAFAVSEILLCGITASPPEREILKTALGATETVSWKHIETTQKAILQLKAEGYKIVAVEQSDSSMYLDRFIPEPGLSYALIFGNEVNGVDSELIPLIDSCIEVHQSGVKHSLNISVCAGVVLWEFYKYFRLK